MTDDNARVEEIRKRCEAAWPGPWWADPFNKAMIWGPQHCLKTGDLHVADVRGWGALSTFAGPEHAAQQQDATGEFIAAAREDVPYLLARLATAEREWDDLRRYRLSWDKELADARKAMAAVQPKEDEANPGDRRICTYITCDSCGGCFWSDWPPNAVCCVCGMTICQSCCDTMAHGEDHGRGNPHSVVAKLKRDRDETRALLLKFAPDHRRRYIPKVGAPAWDGLEETKECEPGCRRCEIDAFLASSIPS